MNKAMVCKLFDLDIDHVKASKGNFIYFESFFYGIFSDKSTKMKDKIENKAKENNIKIEIVDFSCHYHDFIGGSKPGSAKDSYHYVTFKVLDE